MYIMYILCIYIRIYNIMLTPMGLDCTSSTWSISLRLLSFVLLLITCLFLIIIRKSNMKSRCCRLKHHFVPKWSQIHFLLQCFFCGFLFPRSTSPCSSLPPHQGNNSQWCWWCAASGGSAQDWGWCVQHGTTMVITCHKPHKHSYNGWWMSLL